MNNVWLLLIGVFLLIGCADDGYRQVHTIDLPPAGKLYRDYNGNCKLVLTAGEGYSRYELTLEGTCKS